MTAITLVLVSIACGIAASAGAIAFGLPLWALIGIYPMAGMMGGAFVVAFARHADIKQRDHGWQPGKLALR